MAMQHQHNDDQTNDLIINIHPQLRRRLTIAAAQSNLSLEEYIGRILEQIVPPENSVAQKRSGQLNRAAVEDLKRYREEIRRAHPEQMFDDSVELLRQAREERMRELEQR
jgi:predicted metal-dependent RNase